MHCLPRFFLVLCIFADIIHAQPLDKITVVCNNFHPYYYEENGQIKGRSYDIAKSVLDKAGIIGEYKVMPWKRVYTMGKNNPDVMIACIGRLPQREDIFQWIGPTSIGDEINFYKLKSRSISIQSLDDLRQYKTAVLRGSHMHDFLVTKALEDHIYEVADIDLSFHLLLNGRIDLILLHEKWIRNYTTKKTLKEGHFEQAFHGYKVRSYLALGNDAPEELVIRLNEAYQFLKREGQLTFH